MVNTMTIARIALSMLLSGLLLGLLVGCAQRPGFDISQVNPDLTPPQALAEQTAQLGKQVLWGGMIIHANNLADGARLEILAYPLDNNHAPRLDQRPLGRFLLRHDDYLETVDYAPGRRVTVHGEFIRIEEGMIDQTPYRYPVVQSRALHLWPAGEPVQPRIQFGIGIMFGR